MFRSGNTPDSTTTKKIFEGKETPLDNANKIPCGKDDPTICGWVHDHIGNETVAKVVVASSDAFLQIVTILLVGSICTWLARRFINKASERIALGNTSKARVFGAPLPVGTVDPNRGERLAQRARAMGQVLRNLVTIIIVSIMILMILGVFGVDLTPLLASAGILGVALGFGSQSLVKDFLSGLFMIVEDQYGVGDIIDVGDAIGTVEQVGLRVTRLRAIDGTVWYVRNGEIIRVGNQSQGWARAVLDIGIAYDSDIAQAKRVMHAVAVELWHEQGWRDIILAEPEVWGVQELGANSVDIRLVTKTAPLEQFKVGRELRQRIKDRFDVEGIEIPFPQQTLSFRDDDVAALAAQSPAGDGVSASGRAGLQALAQKSRSRNTKSRPGCGESEAMTTHHDATDAGRARGMRQSPHGAKGESISDDGGHGE